MGRIMSPSWFFFFNPPHLPRNRQARGDTAESRSMMVAALAEPMPKLMMVMSSAVALVIGRSLPRTSAPISAANFST